MTLIGRVLPPEPAQPELPIAADWFPAIDPAQLREAYQISEAVKPGRLRELIVNALISVGDQLAAWADARRAAGAASLADVADVPNPLIAGERRLVIRFRHAVGATVKADLVERFRENATPGPGQRRADELEPSVDELRRDVTHAVRDILGRSRTCVELI